MSLLPVRGLIVYRLRSLAVLLFPLVAVAADKPTADDQAKFFENKIRPVLVDKCYSCHATDTPKGAKGGLKLDTAAGIKEGGDSGPAVVPSNPKKSPLLNALKAAGGLKVMPPKGKLDDAVIADFEKWIADGAADPRKAGGGKVETSKPDPNKGKDHWAFQPVKEPIVPKVGAWASTPVDAFVAAGWESQKLTPAKDADKRTLLRRLTFDLTGLPPTPADIDAFLKDTSADAFEKVVDKLLASPAFGERWGRHWLDVARYAESSGKEQNVFYPHAWRYRDYVIKAFNADMPVDQFFKEQLAGDLLPSKDDTDKANKTIATGFLAVGPKSHNERNPRQFQLDVADEQIDAFSQGMLGLTVACARCHDHKFDPIPTKDYYAIAGIFTSTETKMGTPGVLGGRGASVYIKLPTAADVPVGQSMTKAEVEKLRTQLTDLKKQREEAIEEAKKSTDVPLRLIGLTTRISVVENMVEQYDADDLHKKLAMGVSDRIAPTPKDMPIHLRGEVDKLGDTVPRGFVQALGHATAKIGKGESGRKELADWVASDKNPLTARVYVNRVWGHLFGRGLVSSPDNFGTTGTKPTHPELLDYLAANFTANGWSTKKLVRTLVLTHSYRMGSDHNTANHAIDPDNVHLWRMSKRRLDAEEIRDAMLAISGDLDTKPADGSPVNKLAGPAQGFGRFGGATLLDSNKRSVYLPVVRDNVPESLELFDFAEPSLVTGQREDTSVPAQGLYLLNSPKVMGWADDAAGKLKKFDSETEKVQQAFKLALGRMPSQKEELGAAAFLAKFRKTEGRTKKPADADKAAWGALVQALFATAEFRYLD